MTKQQLHKLYSADIQIARRDLIKIIGYWYLHKLSRYYWKTDQNKQHIKIVLQHLSTDLNCIYVRDTNPSENVMTVLHFRRNSGVSNKRKYTYNYNPYYIYSYGPINILQYNISFLWSTKIDTSIESNNICSSISSHCFTTVV